MALIHFLNVKNGDCNIIKHDSGRISIIDVCNGNSETDFSFMFENYRMKKNPTNPIEYLQAFGYKNVFRFILTHPDMDHMDGIKNVFEYCNPTNFWDTKNNKEKPDFNKGQYNEEDWDYYQKLRNEQRTKYFYSGTIGQYFNRDDNNGNGLGDGITILAPTKEMVNDANISKDYNELSYVLLFENNGHKILFGGDSGEKEWNYILSHHKEEVSNIDVLIAPHHGRYTGGNHEYLDVLNPKLVLMGNAKSDDLNYDALNHRGIPHFTNNQGGDFVLDIKYSGIDVYAKNYNFVNGEIKKEPQKKYSAYLLLQI